MARILQDGFETEGKEFENSYVDGRRQEYLGVADLIIENPVNYNYIKTKYGVCSPRGGYGRKGYSIDLSCNIAIAQCACLKYDLTKYCNDTSELFYRVWVKPSITNTNSTLESSRVIPFTLTDVLLETKALNDNIGDATINSCHCVLYMDRIDQSTYELNCYCKGVLVYTYNFLSYDQWVKIDIRLKVGDEETGIFQLRINDKLITTFNGNTGITNPKYLYIGNSFLRAQSFCKISVDDVAVNDTTGNVNNSWCGNGSIVGIIPTANGSKSMFTPGVVGSQNFENVDDIEPDGDATYNSSYALNDIDLFEFTIPVELGIPANETINAISVTTTAKFVEQPTDIGHIISDGSTETLIGQCILSNSYTSQNSIVQEKSNGTKFKVSDIESLEFGYKTLESTRAQEE